MADREPIDLAGDAAAAPGKMLIMLVAANLLITVTVLALAFLKLGPFAPPPDPEAMEEESAPTMPALYESMDKPMIANFRTNSRERYLQLVVQFMTRSEATVLAIRQHMPPILDAIYRELGKTEFETLQSAEGREALRASVLALTQDILTKHTGEAGVEEIYFTTFVFQ